MGDSCFEVGKRFSGSLFRLPYQRFDTVLVEQVDVVGIQARKRLFDHGADAFGAAVQPFGDDAVFETEFGGNDDLFAKRRNRLQARHVQAA
ncbi:hypothetical protein D18P1_0304155 [Aggregatibacter actinomycetemcomitans serotype f str. D18P1]|nr:hypothetical protein D18P1_0304155 [Aggregatibacter actinomycetemcomitans serotype f str. D18P1]